MSRSRAMEMPLFGTLSLFYPIFDETYFHGLLFSPIQEHSYRLIPTVE
jgi:hypothetical protein